MFGFGKKKKGGEQENNVMPYIIIKTPSGNLSIEATKNKRRLSWNIGTRLVEEDKANSLMKNFLGKKENENITEQQVVPKFIYYIKEFTASLEDALLLEENPVLTTIEEIIKYANMETQVESYTDDLKAYLGVRYFGGMLHHSENLETNSFELFDEVCEIISIVEPDKKTKLDEKDYLEVKKFVRLGGLEKEIKKIKEMSSKLKYIDFIFENGKEEDFYVETSIYIKEKNINSEEDISKAGEELKNIVIPYLVSDKSGNGEQLFIDWCLENEDYLVKKYARDKEEVIEDAKKYGSGFNIHKMLMGVKGIKNLTEEGFDIVMEGHSLETLLDIKLRELREYGLTNARFELEGTLREFLKELENGDEIKNKIIYDILKPFSKKYVAEFINKGIHADMRIGEDVNELFRNIECVGLKEEGFFGEVSLEGLVSFKYSFKKVFNEDFGHIIEQLLNQLKTRDDYSGIDYFLPRIGPDLVEMLSIEDLHWY